MIKMCINPYSGAIILVNQQMNFIIHLVSNLYINQKTIYKKIILNSFNDNWIDLDD